MVGPRLALLTRPGCHLCEVARQALDRVAEAAGESWAELDVTGDAELEREYGDRLPVILLDGREHGYWRVEEDRLLRDLARGSASPGPGAPEPGSGKPAPGSGT